MTFRDDFLQRGSFPTLNFWLYINDEEWSFKKTKKEVAFKISAAFKSLFELDFLGIDDLAHFAKQLGGYKP